ncbi:phospholipid scramblase 2-like isoform X3 [Dreissena polymorpha]|nr:phospholipid scramblase 2-like isoform X3 [Dreissena polymorpha]XP_052262925.1 phospholipid scramblase 2-like isoform X3 [Dreissena polymorpha]
MTDNNSQEIIRMSRDFKCCIGCCWCAGGCCQMVLNVEAPVGRLVGRIKTSSSSCVRLYSIELRIRSPPGMDMRSIIDVINSKCSPHMQVFDAADNHLYTLWAPCCPCQCPICCEDDINVPITDPSLTQRVGNIAKVWRGCCREAFTDADSYRLT